MKHNASKPVLPANQHRHNIHARHQKQGDKSIKALSVDGEEATLLLYDDIGEFWGMGTGAESVVDQLSGLDADVKTLTVRINSPGGDVFDGAAIYNALARQRIPVAVHIDGIAASIASLIAMAGDSITIGEGAMFMVHNPWMISQGDAEAHRSDADLLDEVKVGMVRIYSARTGQSESVISNIMNTESWMGADEAIAQGFADERSAPVAVARFDLAEYAYKKVPEAWANPPSPPKQKTDYKDRIAALVERRKRL